EVPLQSEVGDPHRRIMRYSRCPSGIGRWKYRPKRRLTRTGAGHLPCLAVADTIAILGSPTALGGHFAGMDQGPSALRGVNLVERLRAPEGLVRGPLGGHVGRPTA